MKKIVLLLAVLFGISSIYAKNDDYELKSPDGKIAVKVSVGDDVKYSVMHESTVVIEDSEISMELCNGMILGKAGQIKNVKTNSVDEVLKADFY